MLSEYPRNLELPLSFSAYSVTDFGIGEGMSLATKRCKRSQASK